MTVPEFIPRLPLHIAILDRWLELMEEDDEPVASPDLAISLAASAFKVKVAEIRSTSRIQVVAWARGAAMVACREQFGLSLNQTAACFGESHHYSTVAKHSTAIPVRETHESHRVPYARFKELLNAYDFPKRYLDT